MRVPDEDFRSSRIVEVIATNVCKGQGVENDPCRIVTYYSDMDGNLLFCIDRWRYEHQTGEVS